MIERLQPSARLSLDNPNPMPGLSTISGRQVKSDPRCDSLFTRDDPGFPQYSAKDNQHWAVHSPKVQLPDLFPNR
jgi:hypothetical protein